MAPRLLHGGVVIIIRWHSRPKEGDVVVIDHNGKEKIKRVTKIDGGRIFVTGDNRIKSTDSNDFGWLEMNMVRGKLLWPRS